MPYLIAQQEFSWPEAAPVEEPLRTPLWLIRTLAAEELERTLAA